MQLPAVTSTGRVTCELGEVNRELQSGGNQKGLFQSPQCVNNRFPHSPTSEKAKLGVPILPVFVYFKVVVYSYQTIRRMFVF